MSDPTGLIPQHPDRAALQDEAHARPPLDIPWANAEVWHWVLFDARDAAAWPAAIDPAQGHQRIALADGTLRVERHTEFITLTFLGEREPGETTRALIAACPGRQLAGVRVAFRDTWSEALETEVFGEGARLFGGRARKGRVTLATDFQLDRNGLVPFLVSDDYTDAYSRGRMAKRLTDLETYRMAALLALPLVRRSYGRLEQIEHDAAAATMAVSERVQGEMGDTIDQLAALLAETGALRETVRYRISASIAYHDIAETRLGGLDETEMDERRTITSFLQHRLRPAMNTVRAFDRRLAEVSETIASALALARTRLDLSRQEQNQALLASMERRARQQVHLSQAVEGLSVAAITYYIVGLISYVVKAIPHLPVKDSLITAIAIPVIAIGVFIAARRARHHVEKI